MAHTNTGIYMIQQDYTNGGHQCLSPKELGNPSCLLPLLEGGLVTKLCQTLQSYERLPTRLDRKSTRLNSSHTTVSRMPSSA